MRDARQALLDAGQLPRAQPRDERRRLEEAEEVGDALLALAALRLVLVLLARVRLGRARRTDELPPLARNVLPLGLLLLAHPIRLEAGAPPRLLGVLLDVVGVVELHRLLVEPHVVPRLPQHVQVLGELVEALVLAVLRVVDEQHHQQQRERRRQAAHEREAQPPRVALALDARGRLLPRQLARRVQVVEPLQVVGREARARAHLRRREHDAVGHVGVELRVLRERRERLLLRGAVLADGGAHVPRARVDVDLPVLVGVREAEQVADLVRDRRLEVVARDARVEDAKVEERRHEQRKGHQHNRQVRQILQGVEQPGEHHLDPEAAAVGLGAHAARQLREQHRQIQPARAPQREGHQRHQRLSVDAHRDQRVEADAEGVVEVPAHLRRGRGGVVRRRRRRRRRRRWRRRRRCRREGRARAPAC